MLGKLFKHEFKATARTQLPLILAAIVVTLLMIFLIAVQQALPEHTPIHTIISILSGFLAIFYILGIIAYIFAAHFIGVQRYYKNLFSDEGYLTLTLPVKNGFHQFVKMTVSIFWSLISLIVTCLSVISIFFVGIGEVIGPVELWQRATAYLPPAEVIGMLLLAVITVLIVEIYFFALAYFCIALGQTFSQKHKVAAAFIAYIVITTALQIVTLILMGTGAVLFDDALTRLLNNEIPPFLALSIFLLISDAFSLALGGAMFGATNYLTHHKLNLE